jgi:hypothetical protein
MELSISELWYLAQAFGPGWIFGIDDPTEGLSDEEKVQFEEQAQIALSKEGLLIPTDGNQIQIDEMLGGMVYSLLHSRDMLIVRNPLNNAEHFFHFLPQWQMELCKVAEGYELTLFKSRKDLFQHILFSHKIKMDAFNVGGRFSIGAKNLEMASYQFESGEENNAKTIFDGGYGDLPPSDRFLEGYNAPEFHLAFDMVYDRNDEMHIHSTRNEIIQLNGTLYWVSHDEAGEEAVEMMNFISITPSQAEKRFNNIIPRK